MVLPYWPPQTPGTLPMVLPDWPLETLQNPALAGLWALGSVRWPLEMLQNLALARLWALGFRGSRICTRNDERKVFFSRDSEGAFGRESATPQTPQTP